MFSNYHTHTKRCKHAKGSERDYVQAAIETKLKTLGISDHAPFEYDDFGYRMDYCELDDYIDTINMLKKEYESIIEIKKGLEIEYLPAYNDYYEELLTKKGLDYLLLGQHFFQTDLSVTKASTDMDLPIFNICFATDTNDYIRYAKSIEAALQTGYFKILAHPDLCMLNNYAWDDNCERARDIIINAAIKSNTILEFNANGFRREQNHYPDGVRFPYPHVKFFEEIAKTNVDVLIGSDCHNPENLYDDAIIKAERILGELSIVWKNF